MKTVLIWIALLVAFVAVYAALDDPEPQFVEIDQFMALVESGQIGEVWVNGNHVEADSWDGEVAYETLGVVDEDKLQTLADAGVVVNEGERDPSTAASLVTVIAFPAVLIALLYFFLKRLGGGGAGWGNIMELRKSRARALSESAKCTFADVGGCEEAKEVLGDVVDFLKNPKRWLDAGARLPRGVLLEGPPGCGKTLLARAVAGETQANFSSLAASEFVEMFVGVGAARVRDTFETAVKNAPAVVFIDELDAVGRRRGSGVGPGNDEREHTLNQLLVSLDGFEPRDRVVVIAATNRVDVLDPALLRPGRFDRRIRVGQLYERERAAVLAIHTRDKPLADDVSLDAIAARCDGFNGAQLEAVANEAALLAVRRTRHAENGAPARVRHEDFLAALNPTESQSRVFDRLDSVLVESTTQLAEPAGRAVVRITLTEGTALEGEVVWMDGSFVKVRTDDDRSVLVPKHQVKTMEPLAGTEGVRAEELRPDRWAAHTPDLY